MNTAAILLAAAMTSSEAVVTMLNSPASTNPRTYARAGAIVAREAAKGAPLQQFVIGITTKDKALAKRYIEAAGGKIEFLAKEKNNPLAWYLLSVEKNDLSCLRKAADGGNVQALNALGTIAVQEAVSRKLGTNELQRVLSKSFGYFSRAAAQRDPNGLINLGTCYLKGFGCRVDMSMAFECFKAAAAAGHPEGMDYVSACYQFGHGVEKDDAASLHWRMRARAMRGDEAAAEWLRGGSL